MRDTRMRMVGVAALSLMAACGRGQAPPEDRRQLAASESIRVLRAGQSPYYLIYSPPVDLAKPPAR